MPDLPTVLNVETVASSQLFRIERLKLRFSNAVEVDFERIPGGESIAAVAIVAVREDRSVLLIREYAAGTHSYEIGLPKGRREAGEDLLAAANRELMEEVGMGARQLRLLTTLSLAPNYIGHRTAIILAEDLYPCRLDGDEPEPIEVVPWPLDDLAALVEREDFSEARSLAALYLARERLQAPT